MSKLQTVLLASKDISLVDAVIKGLPEVDGYRLIICENEKEAAQRLNDVDVNLFLCDSEIILDLDKNVVLTSRLSNPNVPRIILTPLYKETDAITLSKLASAYLYVTKPVLPAQIALVVKRALELNEISRRHRILSRELKVSMDDGIFNSANENAVKGGPSRFEKLVYVSPRMSDLVSEAQQAAVTDLPVVIHGETGTGKELLARAIHFNSERFNAPLLVQNCGGLQDDVLHSELFGHTVGAFNGAVSDRLGLFRAADGGTVLLDEISEISPNFQVSLLRFLQEGEVKPLGSDEMQHSDVRIIVASNRSLHDLVEKGKFRRDLYYRLKGFELLIPPLRERSEDIAVLTEFFIEKYAGVVGRNVLGLAKETLAKLEIYNYPGNVRELEAEVRRMVAIAEQGGYISDRHLSPNIAKLQTGVQTDISYEAGSVTLKEMVESVERKILIESLDRNHWHQSNVAKELGLSRVGLSNKIKRYCLDGK